MLKVQDSREVQDQYKTVDYNTQTIMLTWQNVSDDRRKREWIVYGPEQNRQLGKITKKKKKKVEIEHWTMRESGNNVTTEIKQCVGCKENEKQIEEKCERWIRLDHKVKAIPEALIRKEIDEIEASLDQLKENRSIEEWRSSEEKFLALRPVEELEVELIRKHELDKTILDRLLEVLCRNIKRDRREYIIYTDGALYGETKNNHNVEMGIGWVQLGEEETWPEEEIALGLNGWPSATIAEIVAIWSAILTVPKGCTVVICTDSYAAIRNISRVLQHVDIDQTLKRKNARWIMSIVRLVRSKNIKLEFGKVKSHSENK